MKGNVMSDEGHTHTGEELYERMELIRKHFVACSKEAKKKGMCLGCLQWEFAITSVTSLFAAVLAHDKRSLSYAELYDHMFNFLYETIKKDITFGEHEFEVVDGDAPEQTHDNPSTAKN